MTRVLSDIVACICSVRLTVAYRCVLCTRALGYKCVGTGVSSHGSAGSESETAA